MVVVLSFTKATHLVQNKWEYR